MKILHLNLLSILLITSITVYSTPILSNYNPIVFQSQCLNLLVKDLAVAPHTCTLSSSASNTKTFTITSNLTLWEIESSQPSWLTVNKWSGSNNATITIIATANTIATSRTGIITVSGAGAVSQTITVTQNGTTTEINDISTSQSINIFPNPSNGKFTLSLSNYNNEVIDVTICDALGNTIKIFSLKGLSESYTEEINLGNISKGLYFVIVKTNKNKVVKTITITNP